MKKILCSMLCLIMILAALPVTALAAYSTTSNTGVDLVYPKDSQYLSQTLVGTVKASRSNGSIYFMPKPKAGNGYLGTVKNGTMVYILAETRDFYFFETMTGECGWNGKSYFTVEGTIEYPDLYTGGSSYSYDYDYDYDYDEGPNLVSNTGVEMEYPNARDWLDTPLSAVVCATKHHRCIYTMPKAQSGNGHLGTVDDGTVVTIYAYQNGYYFFEAPDGSVGWNGTGYFYILGPAD